VLRRLTCWCICSTVLISHDGQCFSALSLGSLSALPSGSNYGFAARFYHCLLLVDSKDCTERLTDWLIDWFSVFHYQVENLYDVYSPFYFDFCRISYACTQWLSNGFVVLRYQHNVTGYQFIVVSRQKTAIYSLKPLSHTPDPY